MGYALPNLTRAVSFDDCERSTGMMIEIKDGYTGFLETDWGRGFIATMFVKQAMDQIQAAGTRRVRWYFLKSNSRIMLKRSLPTMVFKISM